MATKKDMIMARQDYIELIKRELLGPGSEIDIPDIEHELISDRPNSRYSIGILFPRENKMRADNEDTFRAEETEQESFDDNENSDRLRDIVYEEETECINPESNNVKSLNIRYVQYDENNLDEEVGLASQNMPSSMGITFFIKGDVSEIACRIKFATYRKAKIDDCRIPIPPNMPDDYVLPDFIGNYIFIDREEQSIRLIPNKGFTVEDIIKIKEMDILEGDRYGILLILYKLLNLVHSGYVREPHYVKQTIQYSEKDYVDDNKKIDNTELKLTSLRRKMSDDVYAITLMLVNDNIGKIKSEKCFFQPEIMVDSDENKFIFVDYSEGEDINKKNDEEKSLLLQYRNKRNYGTGLGTAVNWKIDDHGKGFIKNDFFPEVEVPTMDFNLPNKYNVPEKALSMKYLSDLDCSEKEQKIIDVESVIKAYDEWIDSIDNKKREIDKEFLDIADKNIAGCRKSAERMHKGIEVLINNDLAWKAFMLANRAMFMQRVHIKIQAETSNVNRYPYDNDLCEILKNIDYYTIDNSFKDKYSWRPFQLAFLLMSIESIVNDNCMDRELVDLIWFPTGGGKTEAYLGLTAFSIFFRRLAHPEESDGTTVIMRYTLRLLAAQQFTRASTLICACEYIRNDAICRNPHYGSYNLGKKPITIGLWIGREHTPNKNDEAKEELTYLLKANINNLDYEKDRHNKFQVLKCPWCGTKLVKDKVGKLLEGQWGYRMKNNRQFQLYCPQEDCFFSSQDSLPIQIVDEELYKNPPTLLFGTVDKFAMLPWNPSIGSFFGINSNNRPPELIIQDELHLISGPLGTMVGLYETAVDAICMSKGIKTKIIASTATIRRASEQCASLYNRDVNQFPHPGIDAEDSFFARESVIDYEKGLFGRKYIGLMPSGKTKAMMEIRSIAALMQKINTMELDDEIKDKYWTLTVYFNSLKDLGKCSTLVDDDVKDFIKRIAYRLGDARDGRIITTADELTSRVSTTQLNITLDKLEKLCYSQQNIANRRWPSNILLATNMISVGIDVARLNVMLLVGQPKLTSEYIQASSRIGREYPGIAFAMYDGSKSRDRSHFEQFKGYHESFYKYVEPTGVTPFSKPARERALHAVVISWFRQLIPDLSAGDNAVHFDKSRYSNEIKTITDYIVERNNSIIGKINPKMNTEEPMIRDEINNILDIWEQNASIYAQGDFCYGEKYMVRLPDTNKGRLIKPYNTGRGDPAFDTMTSMRNVDGSTRSSIYIF